VFDSPTHWAVVAVVGFFLFFGWKQLPDMARSFGRSLRVFKTEIKGMGEDDKARTDAQEPAALEAPKVNRIQPEPRQPATGARPRPAPRPAAQTTPDRPASPS
jgi:sec-independent protein translocase protein TatA